MIYFKKKKIENLSKVNRYSDRASKNQRSKRFIHNDAYEAFALTAINGGSFGVK